MTAAPAFTLHELEVAFELRIVHMVMNADEVVQEEEIEFLERNFSRHLLDAYGYLDLRDNRFTQRFSDAIAEAPRVLSAMLSHEEKLEMLRLFFDACDADGEVHPRELSIVVQAARMIGFSQEEIIQHLDGLMGLRTFARPTRELPQKRPRIELPEPGVPVETTQAGLAAALSGGQASLAPLLRGSIEELLSRSTGLLSIVVTKADVREGSYEGIHTLMKHLFESGRMLAMAGRLALAFEGLGPDQRPSRDPAARVWLHALTAVHPWLPAWVDPWTGTSAELLEACVSGDPSRPDYQSRLVATTIQSANYAVALTRRLGGAQLDHVYDLLAYFDVTDVPAGFFDDVDALAPELDSRGRRRGLVAMSAGAG